MNRQINPLWAGVAAIAVVLIAALIYSGWDFRLFLMPGLLFYIGIMIPVIAFRIYYYEHYPRVRAFMRKYHIDIIIAIISIAWVVGVLILQRQ